MIKSGMCSVTFRNKSPQEIIELTTRAGLSAIEWGSDVHVQEGDIEAAKEVKKMTEEAGLEVSSYGSYYRLGNNQNFIPFLKSAAALGTREIRIWAGINPSAYYFSDARHAIVREAKAISRMASEYGITVSTECHAYTLTDTLQSLLLFMHEVNEPNFCTYWQRLLHVPELEQLHFLNTVYTSGKLTNIHVQQFNVYEVIREQRLLSEAFDTWLERFLILQNDTTDRYALLEFVKDGSEENFLKDAQVLSNILDKANRKIGDNRV